jgi:KRAB domain-containing zinc finger protein
MKSKHPDKIKFQCTQCDFATPKKSHLERHVKGKHERNLEFFCLECNYATPHKYHLAMHVRRKHADPGMNAIRLIS